MKKLIGIALIGIVALVLFGSLPISSAKAGPDALNVDYIGWCLADIDTVDKVALSFNVNLKSKHEIIVKLMDNDGKVVSTGNLIVTNLKKKDKAIIDLSDAPIAIVYYIGVTVKKLPAPKK